MISWILYDVCLFLSFLSLVHILRQYDSSFSRMNLCLPPWCLLLFWTYFCFHYDFLYLFVLLLSLKNKTKNNSFQVPRVRAMPNWNQALRAWSESPRWASWMGVLEPISAASGICNGKYSWYSNQHLNTLNVKVHFFFFNALCFLSKSF